MHRGGPQAHDRLISDEVFFTNSRVEIEVSYAHFKGN
jgi:hypothetical protein